ncbi:hypothetical protein ACF0H5_008037 [Mactra antiquata]
MQTSTYAFIAFSACVYISCTFTTVYAKCSGRWAIHACYGGNGKRSGPPLADTDSTQKDRQYILRQLLLSDRQTSPDISLDTKLTSAPVYDDIESFYPDVASYNKEKEIEKIQSLLGKLLLSKQYRNSMDDDFVLKR